MNFSGKITIEDFMIRVLPGGFFLAVIFFNFNFQNKIILDGNLDFLYSFLFLCLAFITGEILQTIAHSLEFLVDIFFKGYRPSEMFLYKNNPVINNSEIDEIINRFNFSSAEKEIFEKGYKSLPVICSRSNQNRKFSQKIFWKIFSEVENEENIKRSNINYLFLRVIMIEFLGLSFTFFWLNNFLGFLFLVIFTVLLWRARGLAKGLIFKSVLIYLKR